MKNFLVTILILLSTSVFAQGNWIEFGSSYSEGTKTTLYYSFETAYKRNNFLNALILINFSPPIDNIIGSAKFLNAFDCYDYKRKILRTIYYAGQMGEGDMLDDESLESENWEYVLPGSNEHFLLETLCPRF